jgi:hypothetical protein
MNTEEDIRKKEKKLDRNHWMCRVQKYTFGIDAPTFYMGYCPFFWMTWLALLLFPILALSRLTYAGFSRIILPLNVGVNKINTKIASNRESTPLKPLDSMLIDIAMDYKEGEEFESLLNRYETSVLTWKVRTALWFRQNPDWRNTYLPAAIASVEEKLLKEEELQRIKEKRRAARRKLANQTSLCGKFLFKTLIPIIMAFAVYYVYLGLIYVFSHISLLDVTRIFTIGAFMIAGYYIARILFSFFTIVIFNERTGDSVAVAINKFTESLVKVNSGIGSMFEFLRDTVLFTYKAECPMIIWGEETGKIVKREKNLDNLG